MAPDPSPKKTAHYFWVVLRVVIVFFFFLFCLYVSVIFSLYFVWVPVCFVYVFGVDFRFSGLSVFIRMEIFCVCSDSRIVDGSSL